MSPGGTSSADSHRANEPSKLHASRLLAIERHGPAGPARRANSAASDRCSPAGPGSRLKS